MKLLLTALLLASAFRTTVPARTDTQQLDETPPTLKLHRSWRDLHNDLPPWQNFFCIYHGPGGSLGLSLDDDNFKANCEKLFDTAAQSCAEVKEIMKLDPAKRFKLLRKVEAECKAFNKDVKDAVKGANIGRGIEIAVRLCKEELPQVCERWCETKQLLHPDSDRDCSSYCSKVVPFNTGSITCEDDEEWGDCLAAHRKSLIEAKRDPDLEAIMRELTLKCVCVARPATGKYEGHEMCYKENGAGSLMLSRGQKWCEWHDTPSWRPLSEQWATYLQEAEGPMPLPACTEFPKYEGN